MQNLNQSTNPELTSEVVYQLPYAEEICCNVLFGKDGPVLMGIYDPEVQGHLSLVVLLLTGVSDLGYQGKRARA